MAHGALICRDCGGEWSIRELRETATDGAGSMTCPDCRSRSFGI